ncbi:CoA transferase [Microbacterium sp. NPDC058062]|uniref:CaiB/BaiF CoA-transferase family protein n=1 Tax=Microbacterium sp. NPDC058062 TaxID=3346320 RepID=UPI0036DC67A9
MAVLGDVRVLDLSTGVAAPIAAMFLADFGADVIKVEPPSGDRARIRPGFAVWNRNKRRVAVDLDSDGDIGWLSSAIERADVVVLGEHDLAHYGPRVQRAAESNTQLVVTRLPPYLDGSTPWAGGAESNGLLSAVSGQAARQASFSGGPVDSVTSFLLHMQGVWAAVCTVAALIERMDTGRGRLVTVSGAQASVMVNMMSLAAYLDAPSPDTAIGPTGRHHTYRFFHTRDGGRVACGALGPKFETALLLALDLGWILDDERIAGDTQRLVDPKNMAWVVPAIEEAFASRDLTELIEMMKALGIPCGIVADRDDVLDRDQLRATGMRVEVTDGHGHEIVMPGIPFHLTRTPGAIRHAAPDLSPRPADVPWTARERSHTAGRAQSDAGPLDGYTMLNIGTFVATPYTGMLLAELGADVIKVEPYAGDPFRQQAYVFNRGMRSLAIDLQTASGQEAVHRLVAASAVVMDGLRPGVLPKLRLDYETLTTVNPEIITLSLSAYGEGGPDSARPGVDMVIQAESGMMTSQGGDDVPVMNSIAVNDVTTAATSALAITLGLYERKQSGKGQRIWNSLLATAAFLQDDEIVRYEGRPPSAHGGRDFRGADVAQRYYQVSDGWVYIDGQAGTGQSSGDFAAELERAGLLHPAEGSLQERLTRGLAGVARAAALDALNGVGLPSTSARTIPEVINDPELREHAVFRVREEDGTGRRFAISGDLVSFGPVRRRPEPSPPGVGEHTRAVLDLAGLTDDEVEALVASGIVAEGGPIVHRLPIPYR